MRSFALFYASCDSANSNVQIWKEPLNVAYAYKSTPSGQSTPLYAFPSYLPPGSLLSRIATNVSGSVLRTMERNQLIVQEKYRKQEERNALADLQFDSLDNEISTPVRANSKLFDRIF